VARLVAAFGTSHRPALNSPAEDFAAHALRDRQFPDHRDRTGRPATYEQLLRDAPDGIASQTTPAVIAARVTSCKRHLSRLAEDVAAADLDVLLVVGDDQHEQYLDDNLPAFLVYCGETIRNCAFQASKGMPEYLQRAVAQYCNPGSDREFPVSGALARHIVEHLIDSQFDIAYSNCLSRAGGEGHAFGFVHQRVLQRSSVAVVPVVVNTYYPPNQPRPQRCFGLGRALRAAVEAWPGEERVGIIASGGLSHFTIDEELDHLVLDACRDADQASLAELPLAKLNSGNSEIRNWIVVAGAAETLKNAWREYVPLYRSPAGTGCGMAFAAWEA